MAQQTGLLSVTELSALVKGGDIDTVIIAFTDIQGRLVGKRMSARLFVEDAIEHGAECCNYLLAVDVENNTVPGYEFSSWEKGYNDMAMIPDMSTLRVIPWIPHTALVMADLQTTDHEPVPMAPRSILPAQIDRLREMKLVPYIGTELEFIIFDDSFREAWSKGYDNLRPSTDYNVDYDL
ncbi:MAG: glutamine synthetase, partial [Microbacteriaceae bacterium]